MAERPTCATCPKRQPVIEIKPDGTTWPTRRLTCAITGDPVGRQHSCGDHPDMPAWIARRAGRDVRL